MNLMKMGLLFRRRSNPSPMEGKTFKGKALQEGKMDASSEKVFMQKKKLKKNKANHGQSELTQEDINRMMAEGKVHLLLPNFMPQLKSAPRPQTFKRAHVNNFSKSWDMGSWEDHDWLEWTLKVGTTQVTPARFMLERNMAPSSDNSQYRMMNKEEEGDDEMISYWSEDDGD